MSEEKIMDRVLNQYKLAVMYLLESSPLPLSMAQICDVLLDKLFTNFFHLQLAINQLVDAGMLSRGEPRTFTYYHLTDQGRASLPYLREELALGMRREISSRVQELKLEHQALLPSAEYYPSVTNGVHVRLKLLEGDNPIIDLTLQVPGQEAAKTICQNWTMKSQQLYEVLLENLM